MNRDRRQTGSRPTPSGAVVVEFAICAPLLFLVFFAALEFSRVNMIRQSVENAAYEGSRRGIVPGATVDDCVAAAQAVLNTISARDADIDVVPTDITGDTEEVTVSITIPINTNTWVRPFFFANRTVTGSMTLRRERFNSLDVP